MLVAATGTTGALVLAGPYRSIAERSLADRTLAPDEARTLTENARRLTALRHIEPALDANYKDVRA